MVLCVRGRRDVQKFQIRLLPNPNRPRHARCSSRMEQGNYDDDINPLGVAIVADVWKAMANPQSGGPRILPPTTRDKNCAVCPIPPEVMERHPGDYTHISPGQEQLCVAPFEATDHPEQCPACRPQYYPAALAYKNQSAEEYLKRNHLEDLRLGDKSDFGKAYRQHKRLYWEALEPLLQGRPHVDVPNTDDSSASASARERVRLAWTYKHWGSLSKESRMEVIQKMQRFTGNILYKNARSFWKMLPVLQQRGQTPMTHLTEYFRKTNYTDETAARKEWMKRSREWEASWAFPGFDAETLAIYPSILPAMCAKFDQLLESPPHNLAPLAQLLQVPAALAIRWAYYTPTFTSAMITTDGSPWATDASRWGEHVPWDADEIHRKTAAGPVMAWPVMVMSYHAWVLVVVFLDCLKKFLDSQNKPALKKLAKKFDESLVEGARHLKDDDQMATMLLREDYSVLPSGCRPRTQVEHPYIRLVYGRGPDEYRSFITQFSRALFDPPEMAPPAIRGVLPPGGFPVSGWEVRLRSEMPANLQEQIGEDALDDYLRRVIDLQPGWARYMVMKVWQDILFISTCEPEGNKSTYNSLPGHGPPREFTRTEFTPEQKRERDKSYATAVSMLMKLIAMHIAWLRTELPYEYYRATPDGKGFGPFLAPDVTDPALRETDDLAYRLATLGRHLDGKADIFSEIMDIWNHKDRHHLENSLMIRIRLDEIWILSYHLHNWLMEPGFDRSPSSVSEEQPADYSAFLCEAAGLWKAASRSVKIPVNDREVYNTLKIHQTNNHLAALLEDMKADDLAEWRLLNLGKDQERYIEFLELRFQLDFIVGDHLGIPRNPKAPKRTKEDDEFANPASIDPMLQRFLDFKKETYERLTQPDQPANPPPPTSPQSAALRAIEEHVGVPDLQRSGSTAPSSSPTVQKPPSIPGLSLYDQYEISKRHTPRESKWEQERREARERKEAQEARDRDEFFQVLVASGAIDITDREDYNALTHIMNAKSHPRRVKRKYPTFTSALKATGMAGPPQPNQDGSEYTVRVNPDFLKEISKVLESTAAAAAEPVTQNPDAGPSRPKTKAERAAEFKRKQDEEKAKEEKQTTTTTWIPSRRYPRGHAETFAGLIYKDPKARFTFHKPHGQHLNSLPRGWMKQQGVKLKQKFGWHIRMFAHFKTRDWVLEMDNIPDGYVSPGED